MSSNSECFFLKWKNYSSNLTKSLFELVAEQSFVDVTLACEDGYLKAHKLVLSTCSVYFKELLKTNPCKHPIIIFKDMYVRDLRAIVDFMYKGEIYVSQSELSTLLKTAETLKVKGLTENTDVFQKDSIENSREDFEDVEKNIFDDAGSSPIQSTSGYKQKTQQKQREKQKDQQKSNEQEMRSSYQGEEVIDIIASNKKQIDSEFDKQLSQSSKEYQHLLETEDAGDMSQSSYPRILSPNIVQTRSRTQHLQSNSGQSCAQNNFEQQCSILQQNTTEADYMSDNQTMSWHQDSQSYDNEDQFNPNIETSIVEYEQGGEIVNNYNEGLNEYISIANTSQGSKRVFACHLCNVTFTAYSSLRRHMQRHFADPDRFKCEICHKTYTRKYYLKRHKAQKHGIR